MRRGRFRWLLIHTVFISLSQDQRRMIQKFIFIGVVHMEVI